jgi:hypothetical protein
MVRGRDLVLFFAHKYPMFPAPFIEETIFSPFVKNQLGI